LILPAKLIKPYGITLPPQIPGKFFFHQQSLLPGHGF
jgi:hypothetical protein